MSIRINNNATILQIQHRITRNQNVVTQNTEKLASGLRVNRAADDATGLSISEKMRAQIRGLDMAVQNATDGISMIQTAEGGLNAITDLLQRMRELSIKAQNGIHTEQDQENINAEYEECKLEIDRIAQTTTFNGKKLLNINSGEIKVKKGSQNAATTVMPANVRDTIDFSTVGDGTIIKVNHGDKTYQFEFDSDESTYSNGSTVIALTGSETNEEKGELLANAIINESGGTLGTYLVALYPEDGKNYNLNVFANTPQDGEVLSLDYESHAPKLKIGNGEDDEFSLIFRAMKTQDLGVDKTNIETVGEANEALEAIDEALQKVAEQRVNFGVAQNSMEYVINRLTVESENTQASESRIRDVDMAKQMVTFVKSTILQNSSISMLSQANQQNHDVLQLIQ